MSKMKEDIRKRENAFSNWQQECTIAAERTNRPPDYFIRAKIYDRNMKSGTYKVNDVPLDKGMAMLIDFTETKIQPNGNKEKEHEERMTERIRKHNTKKDKKYYEVL